jgi:NADH-quinone oxidoreductase subunit L
MTRVMLMTFFGEKRWEPDAQGHDPHPHESPRSMTIPMVILAFGSVFAGGLFSLNESFLKWLEPVTGHEEGHSPLSAGAVTAGTMVVLVIGVALAWLMYGRRPVPAVAPRGSLLTRAARRDLYQDDFNHVVLVRGGEHLTRSLVYVDVKGVDGVVNGTAAAVGGLSGRMRRLQNGYVRSYAVSMLGGTAVLVAAVLLMRGVA